MAISKEEIIGQFSAYEMQLRQVAEELDSGYWQRAMSLAVSALDHVEGVLLYELRINGNKAPNLKCIECILEWAPRLLDISAIDAVIHVASQQKRLKKYLSEHHPDAIERARAQLRTYYSIWNQIEHAPHRRQSYAELLRGVNSPDLEEQLRRWTALGVLSTNRHGSEMVYSLAADPERVIRAKCIDCGSGVKGSCRAVFRQSKCPKCHGESGFAVLGFTTIET